MIPNRVAAALATAALPTYVYDLAGIGAHVADIRSVLARRAQLYYAVKANSHRPVLETLARHVDGFDVSSEIELTHVRSIAPSIPVIFTGPAKTERELRAAVLDTRVTIAIESALELNRLIDIARSQGLRPDILVRVNPQEATAGGSHAMAGAATAFGVEESQLNAVVAAAKASNWVRLVGLHCHAVSNSMDAAGHRAYAQRMRGLAAAHSLSIVDVGGGFGVDYQGESSSFDWAGFAAPLSEQEETIIEPGRALVAPHGYYAAAVADIKTNHGTTFVILRGGSHHFRLPAAMRWNHPFVVFLRDDWSHKYPRPQASGPVTIAGELCTPNDILARNVVVPLIHVGDVLVFTLAGAYGWHISHHEFLSKPRPELLFIS